VHVYRRSAWSVIDVAMVMPHEVHGWQNMCRARRLLASRMCASRCLERLPLLALSKTFGMADLIVLGKSPVQSWQSIQPVPES
jgi:hypothetical protein